MIYKKKLIELLCVSFFSISASVPLIQQYINWENCFENYRWHGCRDLCENASGPICSGSLV